MNRVSFLLPLFVLALSACGSSKSASPADAAQHLPRQEGTQQDSPQEAGKGSVEPEKQEDTAPQVGADVGGQGTGTGSERPPESRRPALGVSRITIGQNHRSGGMLEDPFLCAITEAGVKCWGNNENRQTEVPTGLGRVSEIAAGAFHVCAIADSKVICWGKKMNPADDFDDAVLTPPSHLIDPSQLTAGALHTCAVSKGKAVCWGNNKYGQLQVPAGLTKVTQISAGFQHTCAVAGGRVSCWGSNASGEEKVPSDLGKVLQVSAGFHHSCAVTERGVRCWGNLGKKNELAPPDLQSPRQVVSVGEQICARVKEGVKCWGVQRWGKPEFASTLGLLGQPDSIVGGPGILCGLKQDRISCVSDGGRTDIPTQLTGIQDIQSFEDATFALTENGIEAWGPAVTGTRFGQSFDFRGAVQMSIYDTDEGCAILDQGHSSALKCWQGRSISNKTPALTNPTSVAAHRFGVCAIADEGLKCWNLESESTSITQIPNDLGKPLQVGVGFDFACAIGSGGLKCWGPRVERDSSFAKVHQLSHPTQLSVSESSACAVDGQDVICWGSYGAYDPKVYGSFESAKDNLNPTQLSVSSERACLVDGKGVRCWGLQSHRRDLYPVDYENSQKVSVGYDICGGSADGVWQCRIRAVPDYSLKTY